MPHLQQTIIDHALPHIPFDGWTWEALERGAAEAGMTPFDARRAFPGGPAEAAECFIQEAGAAMEAALPGYHLPSMRVRDRIALCVMLRLEHHRARREAMRKAVALLSLPRHAGRHLRILYRTVDDIWHGIGDTSTDFNFYSKRLLLAGVYSATLLYWLNDDSPDAEATRAFLARRIDNVMQIEKAKAKCREWLQPLAAFGTRRT